MLRTEEGPRPFTSCFSSFSSRVSFIFHSVILGILECLLTYIEDVNIGAVRVFFRRTLLRIWNFLLSVVSLQLALAHLPSCRETSS